MDAIFSFGFRLTVLLCAASIWGFGGASITINQQVEVGGDGPDFAYDVSPTSDGGFIACGVNGEGNLLNYSVVKVNSLGVVDWERSFTLDNVAERAFSVEETNDGGFVIFGTALLLNVPNQGSVNRPWLLKLDASGDVVWDSQGTFTQTLDVGSGIVVGAALADGTFVAAGGTNTSSNFQDAWLLRVDENGQQLSFQTYPPFVLGFGQGTYINQMEATPDGGFAITGTAGPPLGQAFLWKFDAQAQEEWVQLYPIQQGGFRTSFSVRNALNGGYLLAGCGGVNCKESLLARVDGAGTPLWTRTYSDPGNEYTEARDVLQREDGSMVLLQTRVSAVGALAVKSDVLHLAPDGTLLGTTNIAVGSEATSLGRLTAGIGSQFAAVGFSRNEEAVTNTEFLIVTGDLIFNPNNQPPLAVNDGYNGVEDESLTIDAPGVLVNDSDPDGDPLGAQLVDAPEVGWLTLLPNGSFEYTPREGFAGQVQFTYRVVDGQALGNQATVTITIPDTVQHPPIAYPDSFHVVLDEVLTVPPPGVLANDRDVDGDAITASLNQTTENGILTFNSDGSFTYSPNPGFTGTDLFSYTNSDGSLTSDEVSTVIEVGPFPGLPLTWSRGWGEEGSDFLNDVNPSGHGGFIVAGVKNFGFFQSGFAAKTDDTGQEEWTYCFDLGGTGAKAFRAEQTHDGGFLVIGSAELSGTFSFRPTVAKLDSAGNLLWSSAETFSRTLAVNSAIVVGVERIDGTIAIAGGTNTSSNFQEAWIALISADGQLLDFKFLDPLVEGFGQGTYINDMVATPDGGFAFAGNTGSAPGQGYLWKFDAAGDEEWVQLYPLDANGFRTAMAIRNAMGGGYLMTGCGGVNCTESLAVKTDVSGNPVWIQTYGEPSDQYTNSQDIIERSDGTLLLVQTRFDGFGAIDYDSDVLELDSSGMLLSTLQVPGGGRATFIRRVKPTRNGLGFVLAGFITNLGVPNREEQFYLAANSVSDQPDVFACPDFDGDGLLTTLDMGLMAAIWNSEGESEMDLNRDGRINVRDMCRVVSARAICP